MTEQIVSRKRRQRVSAAERRKGILEAARSVFLESGLAGARTKHIADLAGTSEAILYRHFASKEELFEAAVLEPVEAFVAEMTESSARIATLSGRASRARESYEVNADVLDRMREIAPLLGIALFSDREGGRRFYRRRLEPLLDQLTEAISVSLEGWEHKPVSGEMIVAIQLGTYFWVALQEHFGRSKSRGDVVSRDLTDIFVRAI